MSAKIDREAFVAAYESGEPLRAIARRLGTTYGAVQWRVKKWGLPPRGREAHIQHRGARATIRALIRAGALRDDYVEQLSEWLPSRASLVVAGEVVAPAPERATIRDEWAGDADVSGGALYREARVRFANPDRFVRLLCDRMRLHGISQGELAARSGFHATHLSRWIGKGRSVKPTLDTMLILDEALSRLIQGD